jgi:hypothetical protein
VTTPAKTWVRNLPDTAIRPIAYVAKNNHGLLVWAYRFHLNSGEMTGVEWNRRPSKGQTGWIDWRPEITAADKAQRPN